MPNHKLDKLKVGDKVKSDFFRYEEDVIRKIISISKDPQCSSGYRIAADEGGFCPTCKRPHGTIIRGFSGSGVDGSYFTLVEEEEI